MLALAADVLNDRPSLPRSLPLQQSTGSTLMEPNPCSAAKQPCGEERGIVHRNLRLTKATYTPVSGGPRNSVENLRISICEAHTQQTRETLHICSARRGSATDTFDHVRYHAHLACSWLCPSRGKCGLMAEYESQEANLHWGNELPKKLADLQVPRSFQR